MPRFAGVLDVPQLGGQPQGHVDAGRDAGGGDDLPVDDEALVEKYGIRIPVLKRARDGEELGWPFDEEQL